MAGIKSFDKNVDQYEQWFVDHPLAYVSELHAVQELMPKSGSGMEVGVGTGRFAAPLGIAQGVEPSEAMAVLARKKGIEVMQAVAEKLPYKDEEFDFVLMVTTVCFLDDMELAFGEVRRVLKPGSPFIIGFVDKQSALGKEYLVRKDKSLFYKDATFYSVSDILPRLEHAGFGEFDFRQTLFKAPDELESVEPVTKGHGKGSFVVVRSIRSMR